MKKIAIFFVFICFSFVFYAQNVTDFQQFNTNKNLLQPASLPFNLRLNPTHKNVLEIKHRQQWLGLSREGGQSNWLDYQHRIKLNNRSFQWLVGGTLFNDRFGATTFSGAKLRLAGIINGGSQFGHLVVGFNIGMYQFRINPNELSVLQPESLSDNSIPNIIYPSIGTGIFYYKNLRQHQIYAGISIPDIIEISDFSSIERNYTVSKHWTGVLGTDLLVGKHRLSIATHLRTLANTKQELEYLLSFWFYNGVSIGTGYSSRKQYHLEAGFMFGNQVTHNYQVTFGYNYSRNNFQSVYGDAFEIKLLWLPKSSRSIVK